MAGARKLNSHAVILDSLVKLPRVLVNIVASYHGSTIDDFITKTEMDFSLKSYWVRKYDLRQLDELKEAQTKLDPKTNSNASTELLDSHIKKSIEEDHIITLDYCLALRQPDMILTNYLFLCAAAENGCYALSLLFLEYNAKINYISDLHTPLSKAISRTRSESVKFLLENKADPNLAYSMKEHPLVVASSLPEISLHPYCLNYVGPESYTDRFVLPLIDKVDLAISGPSALIAAAENNVCHALRSLLKNGVPITTLAPSGENIFEIFSRGHSLCPEHARIDILTAALQYAKEHLDESSLDKLLIGAYGLACLYDQYLLKSIYHDMLPNIFPQHIRCTIL